MGYRLERHVGGQPQNAHAATLPLRMLPPRFNRYEGGGHYGFHIDGAVMALRVEVGQLRSDIACTRLLGEPESYDGGELVISDDLCQACGEAASR